MDPDDLDTMAAHFERQPAAMLRFIEAESCLGTVARYWLISTCMVLVTCWQTLRTVSPSARSA